MAWESKVRLYIHYIFVFPLNNPILLCSMGIGDFVFNVVVTKKRNKSFESPPICLNAF